MDRLRQARRGSSPVATVTRPPGSKPPAPAKDNPLNVRLVVRPADPSDASFIRSLSQEAFHIYGPYENLLPYWFLSGIGFTWVAVMKGRLAGFAMLERIGAEVLSPRISELLAIAVAPWARRQGVGDRLMQEILRKADRFLAERLVLHTAVDNLPGQSLFRKHRFTAQGIQKGFYPEGQDALVMERDGVQEIPDAI